MPDYTDLLDELDQAGVSISSLERLTQTVDQSDDWVAAFTDMVTIGRRTGVRFTRTKTSTSDAKLDHIFRGYPFSALQRSQCIRSMASTTTEPVV